jgi:hypothetical protein
MRIRTAVAAGSFIAFVSSRTTLSRYRSRRWVFLVLVAGLFPIAASARGKSSPTYDGMVNFGAQLLHLDDGCLALDGKITSGNFFDDLTRVEIGRRFEFRRHGRAVTEYPDSLTTSIRITGGQCAPALSGSPSSILGGDTYALKFEVEWKDGMQLRPAALIPVAAHCTGYSSIPTPIQDFKVSSLLCQLTVESKGIPLGEHLIVSVFAPDGKRLTRLSARP